jgi:hypothetical protein
MCIFKSNYREIVRVYHPNNKTKKNFENRYASTNKINAQSRNKWKKQIYARAFFVLGLLTIFQDLSFSLRGII